MKRPAFQFYPGDWLRDTALRSVSVGARGAWIDMLCMMHDGTPYGYLKVNLKVILPVNLARILGATLPEVEGWLSELSQAGVYSTDQDGCIYSRRMIRDEELREKRAKGGFSGGNPALRLTSKDNLAGGAKDIPKVDPKDKQKPTPSSSSSSSSSTDISGRFQIPSEEELRLHASEIGLPIPEMLKFQAFYESNGWMVGKRKMKSWVGAMAGWKIRWEESRGVKSTSEPKKPFVPQPHRGIFTQEDLDMLNAAL